MTARNSLSNRSSGFSLIELLVVVVIIGLIMAFAVPAAGNLLKGSAVLRGANALTDEVSRARQHALSKNRVVEVRFYKFTDPETPGDTAEFRAFQCFEIPEQQIKIGATYYAVPIPLGKPIWMPDSVIMKSGDATAASLSSLLENTPPNAGNTPVSLTSAPLSLITGLDPELPRGVGLNYSYASFRFFPDGTTNLAKQATAATQAYVPSSGTPPGNTLWFLTIVLWQDRSRVPTGTPPLTNFATWLIDPVWGTTKTLRPGQ